MKAQLQSESHNLIADDPLELARVIYELYQLGLIAEVIDAGGTPRFRPTANHKLFDS